MWLRCLGLILGSYSTEERVLYVSFDINDYPFTIHFAKKDLAISNNCAQLLSHVRFFATPWTIADQAPLSMGFYRQEYWSELSFPPPGNPPNLEIKCE